jgi:hypothetical protein
MVDIDVFVDFLVVGRNPSKNFAPSASTLVAVVKAVVQVLFDRENMLLEHCSW